MKLFQRCTILALIGQLSLNVCSAREIDAIVADLSHEDFKIRTTAIKELEAKKLTSKALKQLIATTKDPETKDRLEFLWRKINRFIPFKSGGPIPSDAIAQGKEANGSPLFLVRVRHQGKVYAAKYSSQFSVAYIPLGEKEVEVHSKPKVTHIDFFVGKAKWTQHENSKKPLVVGHTKTGKKIYAARTSIKGGIHLGMFVEGDKEGQFPYGGTTRRLKTFEILQE